MIQYVWPFFLKAMGQQKQGTNKTTEVGHIIYSNGKIDGTVPTYWFLRTQKQTYLSVSVPSILTEKGNLPRIHGPGFPYIDLRLPYKSTKCR